MSERTATNDLLTDATRASHSLKEKATEELEENSNPVQADDTLDDSSSSYCTAHCSLSEYSEAFEDEILGIEPVCENASSESSHSGAASAGTPIISCSENDVLLRELETKEDKDLGSSLDVLTEEPLNGQNKTSSSVNSHFMWETAQFLSGPKIAIMNLNLTNINTVSDEQVCFPQLNSSTEDFFLKSVDYFRSNNDAAQLDTKPFQTTGFFKPGFNTSLTSTDDKCIEKPQGSIKAEEAPIAHQQNFRKPYYKLSTECKLDSSESIIGRVKWEREEQGSGDGKEQAQLSLKAGNRKPPASSTSTLTANRQKSGILPRCHSKRLLATSNQHQSQSHLLFRRLKKQSQKEVCPSSVLPPTSRSNSRKHCGSTDSTKRALGMATMTETTTDVRALSILNHAKSSCSESNYLDVLNSTCSSIQLCSDGDFHDWSKDVLSFKLPRISVDNHNTSACSESSSIECIDVAWEDHEEMNRNAKMVPKRQIQLKKRENEDSHAILEVTSTPSRPRDILQRQHSTPAALHQDSHQSEPQSDQPDRKQKLQKSLSLDETSSKNKMASCIIKSVLSKRMQHEQNLHTLDVPDQAPITACSTTSDDDNLSTSAKEVCAEMDLENVPMASLLRCGTQKPTPKTESQTLNSSVKEHTSVISKTQPKLLTKHSFNPFSCGLNRTQFQDAGTVSSETEKEKLSLNKEAWLTSQSTEEKLSCDSVKGKAWNLSAAKSEAVGKQALGKTTPEEFCTVQGGHKQHNFRSQQATNLEKQEETGEEQKSTQCPTLAACLSSNLDASTKDNVRPQCAQHNPEKDQKSDMEALRPPGQSANTDLQSLGKFKAIAPVHVVRDMRSLVKSTYNQSFRCSGEKAQACLPTATLRPISSKRGDKEKGLKPDEKRCISKDSPSAALERVRASPNTTSRVCASKVTSILESHDKIPHTGPTKGVSSEAVQENSCALSKSSGEQAVLTTVGQADVQCSNTNIKQTNWSGKPVQTRGETVTRLSKHEQSEDVSKPGYEKRRNLVEHQRQPLAAESQRCPSADHSDKQDSCNLSKHVSSAASDCHQMPGPTPRSQSPPGPPSACILTVAPTPVFPSFFYKPTPLGYQAVSPNMGAVSYIQGPILLQTPALNQPATPSGPVSFMRSLSLEGCTAQQGSSKQTEDEDIKPKRPPPDTPQAFSTTLGAEGIPGSASMQNPEAGGNLAQSPRHVLLDPETGHCFYVDIPQLPQRKMLFDPETCQYVEVVLPQQSTVMTPPCAIPFPSLHIPAMYAPHCLSYVQAQPQVLPPPGP